MARLTERENPTSCKAGCRVGKECCYAGCVNFQKVQNKLAEYEDLEERGLLIKLPFGKNF